MTERRLPLGLMMILPLAMAFSAYAFMAPEHVVEEEPEATQTATLDPDPEATATAVMELTPAAPPALPVVEDPPPPEVREHGVFHTGAWVRISTGDGDCLNARMQPTLSEEYNIVYHCLPDGHEAYISSPAVEADGHWWWYLAGMGWVAEDYLTFVRDVSLAEPMAPQFAGRGRIAFLRETGIWVMEADGSGQRRIVAGEPAYSPESLTWSPDGTRLSYNITRWPEGSSTPITTLHVIDLDGRELLREEGVAGGGWSPDGSRIGGVLDANADQMGGGYEGIPGWVDVATGERQQFDAPRSWQDPPPSFSPDGTALLGSSFTVDAEGVAQRRIVIWDVHGTEVDSIGAPEGSYYARPRWSPDGTRIAFRLSDSGSPTARYAVYDIAAQTIIAESPPMPAYNQKFGGGCGGGDMFGLEWSRDGRSISYAFSMGDTGANGVWTWDIETGRQTLATAAGGSPPSAGPDGLMAFTAGGYVDSYIFVANTSGGMPVLLTDGRSPVWAPD